MQTRNLIYALNCICFSIVFGAAVYEHVAIWPHAYAAIPASLSMFQGQYGVNSAPFWMAIHPATLLLFALNLAIHWKSERRKSVLIAFSGYVLILVMTATYFVPELMQLVNTTYAETIDATLTSRGQLWIVLSLVRLFVGIGLMLVLFLGLSKSSVSLQVRTA